MKYECNLCNYKTKNKCDHIKHLQTKKHNEKVNIHVNNGYTYNQHSNDLSGCSQTTPIGLTKCSKKSEKSSVFICDFCNREFTRSNNLGRHLKSCSTKIHMNIEHTNKNKENSYINKIELLNSKVTQYEKDYKSKEDEVEYYKNLLMEAGGLVKKSVSALTYSVKNYDDAPHIKSIDIEKIGTFENTTKQIVEDILSAYKHKTLNKYLGEIIVKLYKKDDPKSQSIWNTDDTRLTYLIKELFNNKSSNWIVDKKGIKTVEYLIVPLLSHIKTLIISYQKTFMMPTLNQNAIEIEMMLENSRKIIGVINDIDDGFLAKDVLKYISSHLRFNEKSLELKN